MFSLLHIVCLVITPSPQEKNNLEIDLNYKLKTLQQRLEQEQTEHRVTRAQLTDKYESIEEAKSAAMNGMPVQCQSMPFSTIFRSAFSIWLLCFSRILLELNLSVPLYLYFIQLLSETTFLPLPVSSFLSTIRSDSPAGDVWVGGIQGVFSQSACQDIASLRIKAGL